MLTVKYKPKEFLAVNRQGKVPTFLSDDGLVMFESSAICNYFCRRYDRNENLMKLDAASMATTRLYSLPSYSIVVSVKKSNSMSHKSYSDCL